MARTLLLIGTRKGAFLLEGENRRDWELRGPLCESWPVYHAIHDAHSGAIYAAAATTLWRLLPPIDCPDEPARCVISGTGLTHVGSARDRNAMHDKSTAVTDSMRMFQSGIEGGRPAPGQIGVAPEWFYKGTGAVLRAHGEPLIVPPYAEDGGEEAEIAGVYVIDAAGQPRRIGMAAGNEFSDHRYERRNYLHLAGSKLRTCASQLARSALTLDFPAASIICRRTVRASPTRPTLAG